MAGEVALLRSLMVGEGGNWGVFYPFFENGPRSVTFSILFPKNGPGSVTFSSPFLKKAQEVPLSSSIS